MAQETNFGAEKLTSRIVEEAEAEAGRIIVEAEAKAGAISSQAEAEAERLNIESVSYTHLTLPTILLV